MVEDLEVGLKVRVRFGVEVRLRVKVSTHTLVVPVCTNYFCCIPTGFKSIQISLKLIEAVRSLFGM